MRKEKNYDANGDVLLVDASVLERDRSVAGMVVAHSAVCSKLPRGCIARFASRCRVPRSAGSINEIAVVIRRQCLHLYRVTDRVSMVI